MKAMYRRFWIILLLMVAMTLLAGYVGLVFLPSMLAVWLGAVVIFASPAAVVDLALLGCIPKKNLVGSDFVMGSSS